MGERMINDRIVEVTGWGRTAASSARLVPVSLAARTILDEEITPRGLVARGLGRSYGDCAQNGGGVLIDGPSLSGVIEADLEARTVRALAGTSLDDLMSWFVPLGLFVPVTPGTRFVTVGGAIASDVHGKNHHVAGSWGNHVLSMRMIDGLGQMRELSPDQDPELFWATIGGMGLTGIIIDATIQMVPVESAYISVDTDRTDDLDEVMRLMVEGDDDYDYSVAWIDLIAKGRQMGRSILDRGRFATADEARDAGKRRPLNYSTHMLGSPPDLFPSGLLNPLTTRAFNELWYRKAPRRRRGHIASIESFFHPLDMIENWNRMYGPRGFIQWQTVLPDSETELMRRIIEQISASGSSSFLAVLKRFGPGNQAPMSFPTKGWTLALDIPVVAGLDALLGELDVLVAGAGGRIYLAKDSRMDPNLIPTMYPRFDEWREVREQADPNHRFRSDMSRRLGLAD